MDKFEFVSSLVASLSWPSTIIVAMIVYRKSFEGLLGRVVDFEGLGVKTRLYREASAIEEALGGKAEEALKTAQKEGTDSSRSDSAPEFEAWELARTEFQEDLIRADSINTRNRGNMAHMILAWSALERVIGEAAKVLHLPDVDNPMSGRQRISQLKVLGIIDSDVADSLMRMERLRSEMVHGLAADAIIRNYVDAALHAFELLDRAVSERISSR